MGLVKVAKRYKAVSNFAKAYHFGTDARADVFSDMNISGISLNTPQEIV